MVVNDAAEDELDMRFEIAVPNMYFTDGTEEVFDLLEKKGGIRGIGVNTIMEELTDAEHGSRFPSMVDKLNRPIKGKDVIYVRNHSTFMPNEELYDKTSVKPPMPIPDAPDILRQALTEGKDRGFFFSIMDASLAIPPQKGQSRGEKFGYPWWTVVDDEYKGVRIDGKHIIGVETKSCPNHPDIRQYVLARMRDIIGHYPEIDALYVDHLEFPTYTLEDSFSCFCQHCVARAKDTGIDLEVVRADLLPYFKNLNQLSAAELDEMFSHKSFKTLSRFRWNSIKDFARQIRETIRDASGGSIKFGITGFTPAFSMTGSRDYDEIAECCDIVLPKFYPEHWTVVLRMWVAQLCDGNSKMTDREALKVIYKHLCWSGHDLPLSIADIDVDSRRVLPMRLVDVEARRARRALGDKVEIIPCIHGWGSVENWQAKMNQLERNKLGGYIWALFHMTDEQFEVTRKVIQRDKE